MILAVIMLCLLPSIAHALTIGDRVQTVSPTAVRPSPGGNYIDGQPTGALGTVIGGPGSAWGWSWWQVDYDSGADGWSTAQNLVAVAPATVPGKVLGLAFTIQTTATLTWAANTEPDLASYKIYVGTATRTYGPPSNVGNKITAQASGLKKGVTYYFAVTAVDLSGNESLYSNEVTYTP